MQTHFDTSRVMNTLHICLHKMDRLGTGKTERDVPIEILAQIKEHVIAATHEDLSKEWTIASRCFEHRCSVRDHVNPWAIRHYYEKYMDEARLWDEHPDRWPEDPSTEQMVDFMEEVVAKLDSPEQEQMAHRKGAEEWVDKLKRTFSEENCALFLKRFGLDIWFSHVRFWKSRGYPGRWSWPWRTVAYLILPSKNYRNDAWDWRHPGAPTQPVSKVYDEHGFMMAVNIDPQPSVQELQRFPQALEHLDLRVCDHFALGHRSYAEDDEDEDGKAEESGSGDSNDDSTTSDHAASFPKPMFLVHNMEGEDDDE